MFAGCIFDSAVIRANLGSSKRLRKTASSHVMEIYCTLAIAQKLLTMVTLSPGMEPTKMAKFEFAVFNAEVRQKVADGEHHNRLTDDWADMRYIEIEADNEE